MILMAEPGSWPELVNRLYRGIWPAPPRCTATLADTGALGEDGRARCIRREHIKGLHELPDGTTWA